MPYMSASIQFLVSPRLSPISSSAPSNSSFPLPAVGSSSSSAMTTPESPSPAARWHRTSSWVFHSAVAGVTLPPSSPFQNNTDSDDFRIQSSSEEYLGLHTSVRFQDCQLSLIHIPLHLYPLFVQAILSLIFPESLAGKRDNPDLGEDGFLEENPFFESSIATDFVNISVTPVECSVVCPKEAAVEFFLPIIQALDPALRNEVSISAEDFIAIQVDGEGLDAGQRVLDLTSPLALAKVPIFFITTYFSDYILVPSRSRSNVTNALQQRGFVFEKYTDSFVTVHPHHQMPSASSMADDFPTIGELEKRTFNILRKQNVLPQVNRDIKLVQCAGRRSGRKGDGSDGALKLGLVRCLVSRPQFLSVTLTDTEPASLLLPKNILPMFDEADILLGNKDDVLIPIILDLRGLPAESTGIVCGVAGRLVGLTRGATDGHEAVEMSYMSTTRAGTVMVAEHDISRAVAALSM